MRKERHHGLDICLHLVANLLRVAGFRSRHRRFEMRNCYGKLGPKGLVVGRKLRGGWSGVQGRQELLVWGQDCGDSGAAHRRLNVAEGTVVSTESNKTGDVAFSLLVLNPVVMD